MNLAHHVVEFVGALLGIGRILKRPLHDFSKAQPTLDDYSRRY